MPPSAIPRQDMQALFDRHSTALSLGYRLMVTVREHGFLKKRLAENPPKDFSDMVRWSLTYWTTLAAQQRTASRKDIAHKIVRKTLPEAPHFSTFTYWYPYFLRAYQNHLSGQTVVERTKTDLDGAAERTIRALQVRVATAEKGTAVLRRRLATRDTPVPLPPPIPRREAASTEQDEFPDWDDSSKPTLEKKA